MRTTMATVPATANIPTGMRAEILPFLRQRAGAGRLRWLAPLLLMCLLLSQHAGLSHRVRHGALPQPASLGASLAVTPGDASAGTESDAVHGDAGWIKVAHSCVLFDGAALGAGLCAMPAMPALSHGLPFLPPGLTWRWPHLPPQRAFLTRAPPLSLAFA